MNKASVSQSAITTSSLPPAHGILQRKCACGTHTMAGGQCAECEKRKSGLQRKLTIGASNDPLEQEADRIADKVMRMSDSSSLRISEENGGGGRSKRHIIERGVQPKLRIGAGDDTYEREADRIADQVVNGVGHVSAKPDSVPGSLQRMSTDYEKEDEESSVQRKADSDPGITMPPRTESYIQSLDGSGVPLSPDESQYFETRFGQSFRNVRIHTGEVADKAAQSINARAFTLGNHIAFAKGEYDFGSGSGRKLMAHELTHTLQQSAGVESVQRGSAGVLGGKCCNPAARVEWALVGAGVWKKLEQGECTGTTEDCDGMTCGGGFYHVDNLQTGRCSTPRHDDATFAPRRWTPTSQGADAHSPTAEGSAGGDTPLNYVYDSASTAPCPNGVRTITVDSIRLHGSTQSPSSQLAVANTAYSGCCVRFVAGATPPQESEATTKIWLGGDTDLDLSGITCGTPTTEERSMYTRATTAHGLTSRMRVFYPGSTSGYSALAFSRPPYCAGGFPNHVVMYPSALRDTLAHEFGHILLNSGNHAGIDNPADTRNLMFAPGRTASDLDATQCATIFANA